MTDTPIDLDLVLRSVDRGFVYPEDTIALCDEIKRLRTELDQASEECQRHQVGESYQVGHEHGSAVAVEYKALVLRIKAFLQSSDASPFACDTPESDGFDYCAREVNDLIAQVMS